MPRFSREWFQDASERVAATFVGAAVATIPSSIAAASKLDATTLEGIAYGAGMAGIAAACSALKAILATFIGDPNSASLRSRT